VPNPLNTYNYLPGGVTLLHVLMAGIPQVPAAGTDDGVLSAYVPQAVYFNDPLFATTICGFEVDCYTSPGTGVGVGVPGYFPNTGIAGSSDYTGGWTAEVDFVPWYNNNTQATLWSGLPFPFTGPAGIVTQDGAQYYPPVNGLLLGESYHIIPGTTASSGISLTEDRALQILGHSMTPNHLGPYSQKGIWPISNAHESGEASGIFEVDLNGFVGGNVLGFTWSNEFRTLSWGTISITAAPYQINHTPKTVDSVNGASIDTTQSPPFGTSAGKFVAANKEYITIPNSTDFNFGSNDFTIDFWVKFNSLPTAGVMGILSQFVNSTNYTYFGLYGHSGSQYWFWQTSVVGTITSGGTLSTTVSTGVWYYIAYVKHGTNLLVFQNGNLLGTITTISGPMPSLNAPLSIGVAWNLPNLDGWLKEFRISNGIARWTTNFTPPTTEYSPDQYTALLLHMEGTNGSTEFTDSNSGTVLVTHKLSVGSFYTYDGVYQEFLPTGQYTFTINQPGYTPQTWSVFINPGEIGTGQNLYLEQSNIPVPEFSGDAVLAFSALATSVFLLRRRRG